VSRTDSQRHPGTGARHTNGTLLRNPRPVRQMAVSGLLLPNVIGALGIANQTPPEHNPAKRD
jgi:hypothetical protein